MLYCCSNQFAGDVDGGGENGEDDGNSQANSFRYNTILFSSIYNTILIPAY